MHDEPFTDEEMPMSDAKRCSGCRLTEAAVSRRDFVSLATMSAVAVALTACGGGGTEVSTGPVPPGTGQVSVLLTDFPALSAVGATVKVRSSPPIAVARTATGLVAFSLSCTHQGSPVNIKADFTLLCPNHGAQFTADGVWKGGERTTSLVRLPLTVNPAGTTATITLG